ncbi:MAG: DUF2934 domain-containing protein [Verrucomicrobia bacterium]|nr:DUF2934 domain-containing protein [Verrucomicrobiota bacterium]
MPTRKRPSRSVPAPGPALEVIARLAELMWEKEGCPEGRDIEFWLRAEAELKGTDVPTLHESKR